MFAQGQEESRTGPMEEMDEGDFGLCFFVCLAFT